MSGRRPATGTRPSTAAGVLRLLGAALGEAAERLVTDEAEEGDGGPAGPLDDDLPGSPRLTLTVTEAAAALGVSRSTAYKLVRTGEIPSLRLGSRIVVPVEALRRCVDDGGAIVRG